MKYYNYVAIKFLTLVCLFSQPNLVENTGIIAGRFDVLNDSCDVIAPLFHIHVTNCNSIDSNCTEDNIHSGYMMIGVEADSSGYFVLENVPPGKYTGYLNDKLNNDKCLYHGNTSKKIVVKRDSVAVMNRLFVSYNSLNEPFGGKNAPPENVNQEIIETYLMLVAHRRDELVFGSTLISSAYFFVNDYRTVIDSILINKN